MWERRKNDLVSVLVLETRQVEGGGRTLYIASKHLSRREKENESKRNEGEGDRGRGDDGEAKRSRNKGPGLSPTREGREGRPGRPGARVWL